MEEEERTQCVEEEEEEDTGCERGGGHSVWRRRGRTQCVEEEEDTVCGGGGHCVRRSHINLTQYNKFCLTLLGG